MPEITFSEGFTLPDDRKVRVLAYDDGTIRLRVDGTPYALTECYLRGGSGSSQTQAVIGISPIRDDKRLASIQEALRRTRADLERRPLRGAAKERMEALLWVQESILDGGPDGQWPFPPVVEDQALLLGVTYYINGKPRLARTSSQPYTLSHIANEVIGGDGATAIVREMLASQGVTDPEHTSWDVSLPNGKTISARVAGDLAPLSE